MRLSREKINHLSKIILKEFEENEAVDFLKQPNDVRLEIVRLITAKLQIDDQVDQIVRKILDSYSKKLWEGSPEWEVLYHKLYEEEMRKKTGY